MPLLSFSVLKEKLLDGSKTQTIRTPRKHPLKIGDILFVYWKCRTKETEKLGESIVLKIVRKQVKDLTIEDAKLDGFEWTQPAPNRGIISPLTKLHMALAILHRGIHDGSEVDVITFQTLNRHSTGDEQK
jgi:hypothetical protein